MLLYYHSPCFKEVYPRPVGTIEDKENTYYFFVHCGGLLSESNNAIFHFRFLDQS